MIISIYLDDDIPIHPKDEARLAELEHKNNIVCKCKSQYNNISVLKSDIGRILLFDDTYQGGIINYSTFTGGFPYTRYYHLSKLINPDIKKILVLGLGSGSVITDCQSIYDVKKIDIIEIDQQVINISKEYFDFKSNSNISIHCEEAYQYVSNCKEIYDLILVDVFEASGMPYRLMTKEFIELLFNITSNKGIVGVNYFGKENIEEKGNEVFLAQYKTYKSIFPSIYAIPVLYGAYEFFRSVLNLRQKMGTLTNIIVLASKDNYQLSKPELILKATTYTQSKNSYLINMKEYAKDLYDKTPDTSGVKILTQSFTTDKQYDPEKFIQLIQN